MSQITGTVLSISLSTQVKKQSGGTYEAWELVYKTDGGEVRSIQKPVQGLKFNGALRDQLQSLETGDEFTAVTEKNAAGFIDVKSITKGKTVAEPNVKAATSNYQGRDYETKEERTKRQEYIIRQSSLSSAISLLAIGAKGPIKVEEVIGVAGKFLDFVYSSKPVTIESIENDIPY